VIQPGAEFKVIGRTALDEFTLATPAIANGRLFIRTATKLYCIEQRRNRN
jgi:outer membrane protein assembly factor BamB